MTSAVTRSGGEYVADTLTHVHEIIKAISDTPLWSATDTRITEFLTETGKLKNQLAALELRIIAEADSRDIAGRVAASSTTSWLRATINVTPAVAKKQVALAGALTRERDLTRRAMGEGVVSASHAQVITHAVAELPDKVDPEVREQAESFLIEQAQVCDPVALARLGRRILDAVDPDAADVDEARRLAAQEKRAHQRRCLSFTPDGHGTVWLRGRLDTESAAIVRRALDPLARPRPTDADQPDLRSAGARSADALVEVCRRALAAGGLPAQRAERPQLVVTVDIDKIRRGVGSGVLDTGGELSPGTVRRIACDADIVPAALGSGSIPLDVARTVRLFTRAQRRALILRDKGCAFPGCDRPPTWCDSHHVTHWIDGGATDINNGVLLCGYHHRVIHKGEWRVRIHDGRPQFMPPRAVDTFPKPTRNVRYPRRE
ncbi:MAG: DUF222 domain-containing protein [Micromonosporaceae bacterium]